MVEHATLDGRAVTFRREPGAGPALVCVHGSCESHSHYDDLLDQMPDQARMAVNLPGRAGTDGPALEDVDAMADFLARLVAQEVAGDYVVVGHSLGGAVAIEHALLRPAALRGLVLLATGGRLRVHPTILELFEHAVRNEGDPPPLPRAAFEAETAQAVIEKAARDRMAIPAQTGALDWHACNRFDRLDHLGDIAVPALIVAGTADVLTPTKYAEHMASAIARSELHLLEGAGHLFPAERPEQVAALIGSFLGRVDNF